MTQLNPAEQASIEALERIRSCLDNNKCFRLEAGAGAGKTYSLIESIRYLIDQRSNELVDRGQKIACITYTNVAKDEIKERTDNHPVILADTIHSFCWSILQNFQLKLRELIPELSSAWKERIELYGGLTDQYVKYDFGFPSVNDKEISLHHDDIVSLMSTMLSYPKFQKSLKNRFPIILIDEYQDTNIHLAESIVSNLIDNQSGVILGLFGDHWQKIYGSSACGLIESKKGQLIEIAKKANFRSDRSLVECFNRMRPELEQSEVNPESSGSIKVFHSNSWVGSRKTGGHWAGDLPSENTREYIEKVKKMMKAEGWSASPEKTKILFLTNNLIASEQEFKNLADCYRYNDDYLKKSDKYIKFFLEVVEPISSSFERNDYGEVFQVGKSNKPQLTCQADKRKWSESLHKLIDIRGNGTIGELLDFLSETGIPRLSPRVEQSENKLKILKEKPLEELDKDEVSFLKKCNKIRAVSYQEVINLAEYVDEKTPFSTKHGVKGAQFDNVLVVLGRGWNQYNWNQMFEWMRDGIPQGKEDTFQRSRNLFYVCCTRARHNLAILFTQELSHESLEIIDQIFLAENILGDPFNC